MRSKSVYSIVATFLLLAATSRGEDAGLAKELTDKGAKLAETEGVITGFDLANPATWTDDDFQKIAQLPHLHRINFGAGLTNHQLSLLIHLPEVSTFSTNAADLDDDGVRQFANFKNLTVLTFYHPCDKFLGGGLADLAVLPKLVSLTVGGSKAFGNEGMAAIGKLAHLQNLRIFLCRFKSQGVASLKDLKELRSIVLNYKAALPDDAMASLASVKSLESITLLEERMSLAALSELKQLPALKSLTLTGIDVPESDIEKLKAELPGALVKWATPTPIELQRIQTVLDAKY
jgi:hypothetical protein